MCINLSIFRQFPSLDGRGQGRVRGEVPFVGEERLARSDIHPHLRLPRQGGGQGRGAKLVLS
jgi:hypothetical protein